MQLLRKKRQSRAGGFPRHFLYTTSTSLSHGCNFPIQTRGENVAFAAHRDQNLTDAQTTAILEAYEESPHDEGMDAIQALEEIRSAHDFQNEGSSAERCSAEQEEREELSEEQKREILLGWEEAQRGDYVDARTALEEIRRECGFQRRQHHLKATADNGHPRRVRYASRRRLFLPQGHPFSSNQNCREQGYVPRSCLPELCVGSVMAGPSFWDGRSCGAHLRA